MSEVKKTVVDSLEELARVRDQMAADGWTVLETTEDKQACNDNSYLFWSLPYDYRHVVEHKDYARAQSDYALYEKVFGFDAYRPGSYQLVRSPVKGATVADLLQGVAKVRSVRWWKVQELNARRDCYNKLKDESDYLKQVFSAVFITGADLPEFLRLVNLTCARVLEVQ